MRSIGIGLVVFLALSVHSAPVGAARIAFGSALAGVRLETDVQTVAELQFKDVVRQKLDMSCGSAALATILRCYYGDPVTEDAIIEGIVNGRSREQVLKGVGFSLLELKQAAEKLGYKTNGLKGGVDALRSVQVPVIVLLNSTTYPHFVVVRGIVENEVILADPAFGNVAMTIDEFRSRWNGVFLAVGGNGKGSLRPLAAEAYLPTVAPAPATVARFLEPGLTNYPFDPKEF